MVDPKIHEFIQGIVCGGVLGLLFGLWAGIGLSVWGHRKVYTLKRKGVPTQ